MVERMCRLEIGSYDDMNKCFEEIMEKLISAKEIITG